MFFINLFLLSIILSPFAYALSAIVLDEKTTKPIKNATISDSKNFVKSDINGSFTIDSHEKLLHIKANGYRPLSFEHNTSRKFFLLSPIRVKALYLTFWGASNNSKTSHRIIEIIKQTSLNAVVVDVKNEQGYTSFWTSFQQANSYGAQKKRTNRDIHKFMKKMKENNIYTIARIVTFKDELQAANNPDYALHYEHNNTVWRNHDKMAWVDPFDPRSHDYAISIAQEAAKVGFDEINFDYIRFPAKSGLHYSQENTQQNKVNAIAKFLQKAQKRLRKYGVFISVDTYGNVFWSKDDNNIGQTIHSLAQYADYLAPMLYPSSFSYGSFRLDYPADHPYAVIYKSVKNARDIIDPSRVRPWLQYFKDYRKKQRPYEKFEIQEQIRATQEIQTNGWMMWSPSSKYRIDDFR